MKQCPCDLDASYESCCGRYHKGEPAPTAEALMRSRYSAYAVGDLDYIEKTARGRALQEAKALEKPAQKVPINWTQLKILGAEDGKADHDRGTVTFAAYFKNGDGPVQMMQEKSMFEKIDGHWFYVDGQEEPVSLKPKAPRNAPCPCGSGQKFKQCCGA